MLARADGSERVRDPLRAAAAACFLALQRLLFSPLDPRLAASEVYRRAYRLRTIVAKDLPRRDTFEGLALPVEPPLAAEPPAPAPAPAPLAEAVPPPVPAAAAAAGRPAAQHASPLRELDELVVAAGRRYFSLSQCAQPSVEQGLTFYLDSAAGLFSQDKSRPGRLSLSGSKAAAAAGSPGTPGTPRLPPTPTRPDPPDGPGAPPPSAGPAAAQAAGPAAARAAPATAASAGGLPGAGVSAAPLPPAAQRTPLYEVLVPRLPAGQTCFVVQLPGAGRRLVSVPPGAGEGTPLLIDAGP